MEKIIRTIKIFINSILDMVFPSRCIGCGIKNEIICEKCLSMVEVCHKTEHNDILALYDYQNPLIKKAIWNLKYYHFPYLGQKFGKLLYESFLEEINDIKMFSQGSPIYVIPVPVSKARKQKRGYSQTEIIARSFCNSGTKNLFELTNNVIYKNRETIPQARLTNRNKRLKNLKGAFSIKDPSVIKNKTVIVIDDVTTTGGTMIEMMNILNKAGAKKIIGLAVAH